MHGIPVVGNQVLAPYKSLQEKFARQAGAIRQLDGLADISLSQFLIASVLAEKKVNAVLFGTSDRTHLQNNIASMRYVASLSSVLPVINQLLS